MKRSLLATAALVVGGALLACADPGHSPLAPSDAATLRPNAPSTPNALLGLTTTSTQQVTGATWKTPLAQNVSASATIGALGGTLSLPATGLTVVVPPGAVLAATQFRVTALAGTIVAYDFAPAGSKFLVPLVVTQSGAPVNQAAPTTLLSTLHAGYFKSATDLNQQTGVATIAELLPPIKLDLLGNLTFTVSHFSGYIMCWGIN